MPYNTRRKSLSLPSLGIQLPHGSRAIVHRPPPNKTTNDQPPSKKVKRSHTTISLSAATSPSRIASETKNGRSKTAIRAHDNTPPPSPEAAGNRKIDIQGIDDDIVTGVIKQLEETGNRPHLLKELAAVLSNRSSVVESSANPCAIISSRLTAYIRRPWTALAPCPLGKTLIAAHPRRTYFYLTNTPHQSIPESPEGVAPSPDSTTRIISPALSSNSTDDDEVDAGRRVALSPSPEVDLSSPDLGNENEGRPPTPTGSSFSGRSSLARDSTHTQSSLSIVPNHRAASPPLEGDEKEFTQTASSMQKRSLSQDDSVDENVIISTEHDDEQASQMAVVDETEEHAELRNSEAAAALFGHFQSTQSAHPSSPLARLHSQHLASSLPIRKFGLDMEVDVQIENVPIFGENSFRAWGSDVRSPEDVELDELEDLLGEF